MDGNGALWIVNRNAQPREHFTARTQTHMGLAIVITFSCKADDESDFTRAIESFLFALALVDIRFHLSVMGFGAITTYNLLQQAGPVNQCARGLVRGGVWIYRGVRTHRVPEKTDEQTLRPGKHRLGI